MNEKITDVTWNPNDESPASSGTGQPRGDCPTYSRLEITLDYFKSVKLLPFDQTVHTSFESLIRQKLRVGTQDLRIAAIALSVNGIVVTRNQKDFGKVPNLQVENWAV